LSVLKANCPSCAAPIEFQKGSTIVLVCPFCRSAVARTDRGLADLGKVAEILDSESPLKLGLKGHFKGQRFELTGRAQMRHELGGVWDEWYATFSNGWVGWLAEAQGKFYLTFYQPLPEGAQIPAFDSLQLGQTIEAIPSQTPLMVTEKGTATSVAADGEIPYRLEPNERSNYADLSGKNNAFGTIDYSINPPWAFVGNQVSLEEIGLGDAKSVKREAQRVSTEGVGCPNCAGPLSLTAPDKAERVTCPYCNSLLDVNQGKLTWLKALSPPPVPPDFVLKIGMEGTFMNDAKFRIIGAVVRSVNIDGVKYFWHEYLLYNPLIGFRWLVHSDNHWNFVEPVNPADVESTQIYGTGSTVNYNGQAYKIFQDAPAMVEFVQGEFYWRVEQGETVRATDYVAPPLMLSKEIADKEINWSLGTFLKREEVEKAFNVTNLPYPTIIAPNQPFLHNGLLRASLVVLLAAIAVFAVAGILFKPSFSGPPLSFDQVFLLPAKSSGDVKTVVYSSPVLFEKNSLTTLTISADIDYERWSEFDVSLVPANTELNKNDPEQVKPSEELYKSWAYQYIGSNKFNRLAATGEYQIRAEGRWQDWEKPLTLKFGLTQYARSGISMEFLLSILFFIPPVLFLLYKAHFEGRRWEGSNMPRPFFLERIFSGVLSGK